MKFKIFWIEDSKTWIKSALPEAEETFTDHGFEPHIQLFEETSQARDLILNHYADLILVDCNLPNTRGDDFIKDLRANRCFSHVIFYSQNTDNLGTLAEDKHFLHVTHRNDIQEVITTVADQAYRKYKHPAFMRGLLLSEFIDLENLMEDLIVQCFRSEGEYFRKTVIHKGGEGFSLAIKQKFITRLINEAVEIDNTLQTALSEINFTSSQFNKHIIKKRNILAHAYPEYDISSGEIALISPIDTIDFSSDWFNETREKIHEHKFKLRTLIDLHLHKTVNPDLTPN